MKDFLERILEKIITEVTLKTDEENERDEAGFREAIK